ncbi:class I adenylate-forming enzyme family protein [Chelatococcus reniformis]|nr:long-chain-fatty-acid--CoA ligase [Chelatococcus reniformis]
MTVAAWIRRNAHWRRDKLALVSGDRRYTYGEFNERVNRQANGLLAEGLVRGDRVAVIANNTSEAVEALGAAAKAGLVHVPINFRLSPREVEQILTHSGARIVLAEQEFAGLLDGIGPCPDLKRIIRHDPRDQGGSEHEAWLAGQPDAEPPVDVTGEDDLLIVYTSGTTGSAKGAFFKQKHCVAHAPVPALVYDIREDSRLLMVYPHNSIASMNMYYIPAWMQGATVVLADARGFSAERWLGQVERERITHCHLVPTMLIRVLDSGAVGQFDVSSLQTVGYGSAPMPKHRVEELSATFGNILVQGYGMTETSSIAAALDKAEHRRALAGDGRRLASCGRPVFGCELRVVGEDGHDVKPGELGEIIFRGPYIAPAYFKDPERTAQTIVDGWLHSGDLAELDEDGFIYIVDRKNDIIISGGFNVASKEVEEVLCWHDAVREAAVVSRPDPEWGERVHAFVALREGAAADAAELIAFCRDRLSRIKCPDRIEFVEELPRNALGKLVKGDLRARARARAQTESQAQARQPVRGDA